MLGEQCVSAAASGFYEGIALEWLAFDARARLIVSADLRVRWHNPRALECLRGCSSLHLRNRELVFGTPTIQRTFAAFVFTLDDQLRTLALAGDDEDDVLLLRGWGTRRDGVMLACLEIIRDNDDFVCEYRDIDTVFRLTPAEHRIVVRSLSGHTVTTIAAELGLSVDTVRTHVRHIYSKVGVGSREELLGRLSPYRVF